MRRVLLLILAGVGLWLLLLGPAWWWYGELALVQSGVALTLSLVPSVITIMCADYAWKNSPEMQLLASLGGSVVRMGVALGIGTFLYYNYPATFTPAFWGWLLGFYLALLALEVTLLIRSGNGAGGKETKVSI